MGRIVVTEYISVDGVVEAPSGTEAFERVGWTDGFSRGPEGDQFKVDETMAADAQLLGRITYEGFAAAWPSREGEFADRFNSMPKYVVSTTLDAVALDLELGTVALLKMNIEGAERSAVRGMETLARKLRHVVISCHDFIADRGEGGDALRTFDYVQAVLESLGFETSCRADHVLPWVRYYIYGRNRTEV